MAELLCRVCLVGNVKMQTIENTELQEIYELLARNKLVTEDGRSKTICYICYSQLQKCCRFSDMMLRSDKIFEYLLKKSNETTQEKITHLMRENPYNLAGIAQDAVSIGSTETISIDTPNNDATIEKLEMNKEILQKFVKELKETDAKWSLNEEKEEYENNSTEIAISDSQNDPNLENPLESNNEGVVNVPASKLLTHHSAKYMDQRNKQIARVENYTTDASNKTSKMEKIIAFINERMKNYIECEVCDQICRKGHDLDMHMQIHNDVQPHAHNIKCKLCAMKFTDKIGLQHHFDTSPPCCDKVFRCNNCNKGYAQRTALQKHYARVHNKMDTYICKLCQKTFYTKVSYDGHSVTHFEFYKMVCNIM